VSKDKKPLAITGVLLAGGESRRMGRNKALLEIGGKTLAERTLAVLQKACREVLISSRTEEPFGKYGFKVIPDVYPGSGPLGGLYSVLDKASYDQLFLVACDMPFVNEAAVRFIYDRMDGFDAIVPYAMGKIHPLHAFYHKRITPLVEEKIKNKLLSMAEVLQGCRTKILNLEDGEIVDREGVQRSLINVNTPEEWENYCE
jgi:molybdopterin-guanine dinucleotide biosynthesis protein A